MSRVSEPTKPPQERVLMCGVLFPEQPAESEGPLSEARGLVEAAGAVVVGDGDEEALIQRRQRPDASTMMGKGKVQEVRDAIERLEPDAVLVDNDLSPAQGRNLEKAWGKRVIDRSELILDIFAARAQTAQARLQVELAQTEYLRPRLKRMWTHLERTEGAVGTRGPGETQLETDRRLISKRITDLKHKLDEIEQRKRRQVRSRSELFTVGFLGYTNAGKSTLLNRLTGSNELVADMPFATLDTRTRQWKLLDGRLVLLSDTVGFLQRLPHHLVASFHATLEEALNVDLLLHIVDAAHPDARHQMEAVEHTLAGLTNREADGIVLNKCDRVADPIDLHILRGDRPQPFVHVSAVTGEGLERLDAMVAERLDARSVVVEVSVPLADGKSQAALKSAGVQLGERTEGDQWLVLQLRLLESALGSLKSSLGDDVHFQVLEEAAEPYLRGELLA
ncbi:MAG: GTPase HflX [Deltaproteobacteria bacterium]|nr:GTPase HflX [Deltaproteobacteria bacterium]